MTQLQSGNILLGVAVILVVRYGVLGNGSVAEWSAAGAGVVLAVVGAVLRNRAQE